MGFSGNKDNEAALSWRANLTGIPDTDEAGQYRALSMGLLSAGASMARNNQPGLYGSPGIGSLAAQGLYDGIKGIGAETLLRNRRMVNAAKAKMARAGTGPGEQNSRANGMGFTREDRDALPAQDTRRPLPPENPYASLSDEDILRLLRAYHG